MTGRHQHLHIVIVLQRWQSLDVSRSGFSQQWSQLWEETTVFYQVSPEQHGHHGRQVLIR